LNCGWESGLINLMCWCKNVQQHLEASTDRSANSQKNVTQANAGCAVHKESWILREELSTAFYLEKRNM